MIERQLLGNSLTPERALVSVAALPGDTWHTWQEHNPAKLKSRVLIVERRYAARKLKRLWLAWAIACGRLGREVLNAKRDEQHWKTRWKIRFNGSVSHALPSCLISCPLWWFRISSATSKDSKRFLERRAYWIIFLKQKQPISFLTIDSYLSIVM